MIILILIVFGLALGSFVNAFVWRLHEGKDWIKDRSECVHCHHKLASKDLIPVLSYVFLRGKCRYCKKPINDSPWVELAVPLLFVASYLAWPMELIGEGRFVFILWLIFIVGFVILALYDLKWFLLPDRVVFPLIVLAVAQVIFIAIFFGPFWQTIGGALIGAVALSGLFYTLHKISKGAWIGFGDVKLAIVLGMLAGGLFPTILLLFVASVSGMLVSLPLLLKGKNARGTQIPFGPFLLIGMFVVQLFGQDIIDWYTGLLIV